MDPSGPVIVVVANPAGAGRTGAAAEQVAARVAEAAGGAAVDTIDLAVEPERLLGWGSPLVAEHKARIAGARALVVASPTYKATYTGLLKVFLDQFDAGELGGIPTVGVMTGGAPLHSLAVDVHLAPLLFEIGASLPARGLYLAGPAVDDPVPALDTWWHQAGGPLTRAVGG